MSSHLTSPAIVLYKRVRWTGSGLALAVAATFALCLMLGLADQKLLQFFVVVSAGLAIIIWLLITIQLRLEARDQRNLSIVMHVAGFLGISMDEINETTPLGPKRLLIIEKIRELDHRPMAKTVGDLFDGLY